MLNCSYLNYYQPTSNNTYYQSQTNLDSFNTQSFLPMSYINQGYSNFNNYRTGQQQDSSQNNLMLVTILSKFISLLTGLNGGINQNKTEETTTETENNVETDETSVNTATAATTEVSKTDRTYLNGAHTATTGKVVNDIQVLYNNDEITYTKDFYEHNCYFDDKLVYSGRIDYHQSTPGDIATFTEIAFSNDGRSTSRTEKNYFGGKP